MSEQSPKKQLLIARDQLDKLSILIANLAVFFHGASPAIDDDFQQIKALLLGEPDLDQAIEQSVALNAKLRHERKFVHQQNAAALSKIRSSLSELEDSSELDESTKLTLKRFSQSLVANASQTSSPIAYFEKLIALLKQALGNNVAAETDDEAREQQALSGKITSELQALIAPFYAKNKQDQHLIEIKQKLEQGLGNKELLECCLGMIRFVMQDVLTEASAATKLIDNIHSSIVKINKGIDTTISKSRQQIDKQEQKSKAMQAQIDKLETALLGSENIADIKSQSSAYLVKLQNSLQKNQREDKAEQEKVIALLQSMQKRLDQVEAEAESYKQKLIQQRQESMTDALTKLPNRAAYEERIKLEWENMRKNNTSAFMAVVDIDHFKRINDNYGHSVGDKTLQVIASHTRKLLAPNDFLARWGGEEFVALLPDTNQDEAFKKLENVRQKIAKLPFMFKGNRVSVTISIGLTDLSAHANIADAFEQADALLYKAKKNGRNQTCAP